MLRRIILLFYFFFLTNPQFGQTTSYKIISQDVINFWEAVDSLKSQTDTIKVFQNLVIDRASDEFKVFIRKWKIKASEYAYQIRRYPKFYKSLRENCNQIINSQDSIRRAVRLFQSVYPSFVEADICIAFGNFKTGGNIEIENGRNLVYIGLEYHGLDSSAYVQELNISTRDYVSRSNFFRTIIHELVHVQQYTHGKKIAKAYTGNLLANRIISEGIPDFIAKLIVPNGQNGNYYNYGIVHEKKLKEKLNVELWTTGYGDWFGGNDVHFIDMPRDLGYFMGSKIGESFYISNDLSKTNLTKLIEIENLKKFIFESKYFNHLDGS